MPEPISPNRPAHPGHMVVLDRAAPAAGERIRRASRSARAIAMAGGLPLLTCYLYACLALYGGELAVPALTELADAVRPTAIATAAYLGWLALQVFLYLVVPGTVREGTLLETGGRLQYRLNGWRAFWATTVVVIGVVWLGWMPATFAYDQFGALLTTASVVAFAAAALLHAWGRWTGAAGTGNGIATDFVMGLVLNPRFRSFDVKFFCEGRPGLMLWVVFNASFAAKQYELYGFVSTPMLLVNAFQLLYVADYFFHEDAIVTTWDIKHERFGWMLCWGSLVWVPFTYTIQAYYLVTHTHDIPTPVALAIIALNGVGYLIFRSSNLQKHRFRSDPTQPVWGRRPRYIRTDGGALLLASGWWGVARHSNYLGDLLMGLAWCLAAGFTDPLPYFYFAYLVVLLILRERRDHAACLRKYGRGWEAYCQQVRWRIVPGLY